MHPHSHEHPAPDSLRARLRHALTPHSHDHLDQAPSPTSSDESSRIGIRAAWISLAGMGITAALQLIIVWLSGSVALLADTIHTLGHLATTIPLIIAFQIGRRRPTRRYSYGFGRAEDLAGLVICAAIAISVAIILRESINALSNPRDLSHTGWVIAAAVIGALGNEAVAWYRIRAGRRIGSAALIAEGQHARADALTSLAVILGVLGSWLGMPWIDPLIGLFIAAAVTAVLYSSMRTVLRRLMDGVEDSVLDTIGCATRMIDGVSEVTMLRARWSGHRLFADLDITAADSVTVEQVTETLLRTVPHLHEARVHIVAPN